ncbi:MAG: hypothetical protein HKN82_14315 [Akkermansiaceae bacterium]|nr:hypothetical protein [Akkermansiaceae bacterium]
MKSESPPAMTPPPRRAINRCLCLFAALLAVAGGERAAAQSVSVRAMALRSGEMPEVYLRTKDNHELLAWSDRQPGEVVRALRANPLPLFKEGVDAEGKPAFVPDRRVPVPAGANGILLLGWNAGQDIRYVAIEDNFAAARFNHWLFVNTSKRPVAFQVGDKTKPLLLAPGVSTTHRIGAPAGEGVTVRAEAPFKGKAKEFFSTYWPVQADKRTVVLLVDEGAKIRVKRISDKLAAAKP